MFWRESALSGDPRTVRVAWCPVRFYAVASSSDQDQLNDLRRRSVGARVKALRTAQNLTQKQLADLAGTTRGAISSVEGEGRNITLDTLYGIADGLGVHAASLLDDRLFRLPQFPDPDKDRHGRGGEERC